MRFLLCLPVILITLGAQAQVSGRYTMLDGQFELALDSNGTYKEYVGSCLGDVHNEGRYTMKADTIYLQEKRADTFARLKRYYIYKDEFLLTEIKGLRYRRVDTPQ